MLAPSLESFTVGVKGPVVVHDSQQTGYWSSGRIGSEGMYSLEVFEDLCEFYMVVLYGNPRFLEGVVI